MARKLDYDATRRSLYQPCADASFFSGGTPRSEAALCSELVRLAYCDESTIRSSVSSAGLSVHGLFTAEGGLSFLAKDDERAILVFRGTVADDPTNILDDLRFLPEPWSTPAGGAGSVHRGFVDALERLWPAIEPALQTLTVPLVMTGHSLGAALATLAASIRPPERLITIASPRVGDAHFCQALASLTQGVRYVNCCDIVTDLPPPVPYQHFGRLHYIDREGEIHVQPEDWFVASDRIAAHADYLVSYAWRRGNLVTRSLADHAPINYVSALIDVEN